MLKNYFKIAFRNLRNSKLYSAINISGMAVSLAACILLLLWVKDELSFDHFHKNINSIYKIAANMGQDGKETIWDNTPAPLGYFAQKELPEVAATSRVSGKWDVSYFEYNNKKFNETRNGLVDAPFFSIFSFPLVKGNPLQPFTDDQSVILSESVAAKIFGTENPIGKTLKADDKKTYHVTGVMQDMPKNSSIRYNVVFNFELLKQNYDGKGYWKSLNEDWGNYNFDTYLQLKPGSNAANVAQKLTLMHRRYQPGEFTKSLNYLVNPVSKMHLYASSGKENGMMVVRIFFIVAVIVLLIACINYVNLITARAAKRSKEISLRKIIGAGKANLFWQFLSESFLIFLISLIVATVLIYLVMPLYNDVAGKQIVFNPLSADVLAVYGITLLATFLLAGIYPAITLSSFKPLEAMKGKLSGLGSKGSFRKVLVVVQFTFSIILIVSTIIISKQLKFIREKNLGYDKENIFVLNMREIGNHYDAAKAELLKQPGIIGVTESGGDLMENGSSTGDIDWDGKALSQQNFIINQMAVEKDFLTVLNIKLAEGKTFTGTPSDSTNFILNETAIKQMGIKNPIGKRLTFHEKKGVIIGVAKDFHFASMHQKIEPLALFYNPGWIWKMYIKTTAKDAPKAIAAASALWKKYNPNYTFEYTFLDDAFDSVYKSDNRIGKLFNCFAVITIFISCLGLFGLVTFTAESKVKEIGVRKVLGAGVPQIVTMLSKDFLILVIIAGAIAFPAAWWGLGKFLEGYAYRTDMSWWVFAAAGVITLLIAVTTISFKAVQAALANPVKSLRTE
jgi:putative ABC transport system permease protein